MSWYNNNSTDFIDGTQQFTGGSTTIINGGDDVSNTPSGDITDLIQLVNNDTFVKNIYTDGRIYFYVKNAVNDSGYNYNTRINNDGVLQYYHSFTLLVPTKLSGFYNVGDAITGLEQGAVITGLAVATIQGEVTLIQTDLTALNADYFAFKATTITEIADLYNLLHTLWTRDGGLKKWSGDDSTRDTFDALWNALGGQIDRTTNLGGSFVLPQILKLKGSKLAFLSTFINRFNNALTYAGIGAGIYGIYKLLDTEDRKSQEEDLLDIQGIRLDIEDNVANGDTSSQQLSHIYIDYLTIDQTTNNNFTTAGIYESISIQKGAELAIEIKDVSGTLQAEIVSVMDIGSGFSVNEEIFINKSDIGGTTGQLRIVVSQLTSFAYILEQDEIKASVRLEEIDNRIRRRLYIPNKDDFSTDGFNVIQTFTTEPTGESLSQIEIELKVDTSQFSYDGTGNLQINNYGTIPVNPSQFQYVGGNLELINYSQIGQNATDISTIQGNITTMTNDINTNKLGISANAGNIIANSANISTLQTDLATLQTDLSTANTNIGNNASAITITNGNVSTNATDIANLQTDITNLNGDKTDIYQLILNDGETPSTTTTKQVNIGFNKSEFNNIIFPLIMGAVKLTSTQEIPFNITDFRGYYFGTYPDMTRLNYNEIITLVKQDNSYYYNDTNWNNGGLVERGAYYFKNEQTGFVYDLNRRFEYLGFHRFKTNISGQNTYVIRTAYEFEEVVGIPSYSPDPDKLQFYLRDGKFYFSHLCKYDLTYYAIRFNQNILSDFINPIVTFSSVISPTGNNRGTLNLNITQPPFNEDYYLRIDDSLESITRTEMENLFDTTTTHSNERFCGMVQNFTGQAGSIPAHEPFGSIVLFQSQYTTNYRIARIELEYQFKIRDVTNSFWIVSNPQTQSVLNQVVEELVFDFFNSSTDSVPADTIPLNNRVIFNASTNTISINFDKSPDTQYYLYEKWSIRPRFISGFTGYSNQGNAGYNYVANQRSAFIKKVKLFPYVQKTITRELVEEFSDNTHHNLGAFDYNKINLHIDLNNHISPYNDIWYKLNDNLDANKYQITIPQSFNTTNFTGITDLPPNVTSLPTDNFDFLNFDFFVSSGQTSITELNDILIIGDEDIGITQYETHFGWRFLLPSESDMSETDLDNYDYLKTYNYYHRTAICDRFFSCKEFYADIIDFKNLLVDGTLAYDDMTTSEFSTLSQNSDGFNLKSLSSVNIQNLYGLISNGFLYFDTTTGFSTQTANVTNYWTQINAVKISYPNTIEVDRVNTTTIVFPLNSPSSSITFSDGSFMTTAQGLSYSTYTDADVKAILALSGGNNITWNTTTEQFDLDSQITTDISNNASSITTLQTDLATANTNIGNNTTSITNLNNLIEDVSGSTKIKATSDIIFENNSLEKMRLDVNGNLGIGVNPPVEPIDFQHIPNGWFKINNFGHLLMRNTQSNDRWNLSIRNSGLFSISCWGGGGQHDNGVMPSQYNKLSILPNGNVGINNNNPTSLLDVSGTISTFSLNYSGGINGISPTTFSYLANVTSDIQTQINNLTSYTDTDVKNVLATSAGNNINWNTTTEQFDLDPQIPSDITTLNNLIYDDTNANTTYINGLTNFVVNLNGTQSFKCQPNLLEIRTPPTSTQIPFFRLVQSLNNHQAQFYISGFGNNDMVMDRIAQSGNPNSGLALRVGGNDKIRVDGTGTIVIPNQIGTGNPTNSSYGLEIQHGTTAITGSGSFLLENGVFVVGSLTATGNSIFDVNSSSGSFTRINPLGMFLIKNQNNNNRFQIGIRNNGDLCIGNDTSTTSGTMGGANDKLKVKSSGEVEVRYNLKVGDANGALLTELSLLNLPTSAPAQANRVYRDSNGFLRIT